MKRFFLIMAVAFACTGLFAQELFDVKSDVVLAKDFFGDDAESIGDCSIQKKLQVEDSTEGLGVVTVTINYPENEILVNYYFENFGYAKKFYDDFIVQSKDSYAVSNKNIYFSGKTQKIKGLKSAEAVMTKAAPEEFTPSEVVGYKEMKAENETLKAKVEQLEKEAQIETSDKQKIVDLQENEVKILQEQKKLESENGTLKAKVAKLETENTNLKADTDSLKEERTALKGSVDTLTEQNEKLSNKVEKPAKNGISTSAIFKVVRSTSVEGFTGNDMGLRCIYTYTFGYGIGVLGGVETFMFRNGGEANALAGVDLMLENKYVGLEIQLYGTMGYMGVGAAESQDIFQYGAGGTATLNGNIGKGFTAFAGCGIEYKNTMFTLNPTIGVKGRF